MVKDEILLRKHVNPANVTIKKARKIGPRRGHK